MIVPVGFHVELFACYGQPVQTKKAGFAAGEDDVLLGVISDNLAELLSGLYVKAIRETDPGVLGVAPGTP